MSMDYFEEQGSYFAETAIAQLELAEKCRREGRIARAQHYFTEARYWAFKAPAEKFTGTDFQENIRELERKIF